MIAAVETQIVSVLHAFQVNTAGLSVVYLVSTSGRGIASSASTMLDRTQLSGTSAASVALARKACRLREFGELMQVSIVGERGSIFLLTVGLTAVLVLVTAAGSAPDPILAEGARVAKRLETMI